MVKIRLRRTGAKKAPSYRIVAAENRFARDGRFIENLGYYNPLTEPATVVVKEDRLRYWMEHGAQPTDVVSRLLDGKGGVTRKAVAIPKAKVVKEAPAAAAPVAPTPAAEPEAEAPAAEAAPEAAAEEAAN